VPFTTPKENRPGDQRDKRPLTDLGETYLLARDICEVLEQSRSRGGMLWGDKSKKTTNQTKTPN